ncbi:MAG: hypothetical protein OXG35_30415 [Acidobacteria bacterium]|nr:hypothetical protein [Acidobacteriota bacterium]
MHSPHEDVYAVSCHHNVAQLNDDRSNRRNAGVPGSHRISLDALHDALVAEQPVQPIGDQRARPVELASPMPIGPGHHQVAAAPPTAALQANDTLRGESG